MKQYILVLLLLGIIVINSGCTQPPQEPVSPNTTYSPNLTQTNAIPSSLPPTVKDTNIPLFVYSKPVGASIFLDGADTGLQSIGLLKNVSTGSHTIVLKLDGYYDSMREAHPIPQGANTLNIPLIRIPNGSITVNSDPAGAAIYFDDTFTGKTTNDTLIGNRPWIASYHGTPGWVFRIRTASVVNSWTEREYHPAVEENPRSVWQCICYIIPETDRNLPGQRDYRPDDK